ncbi:PREDICTED: corticoliberin [Elephantulus edwardii]|uniref:corticoliberin n=1 Tax=Elephantulus edwardii TaxID=28737 RepID=UPI0003F0B4ED|nr:PREDICTED: corticoliberin [Elephantulus edwardii]
MRLPLLVAVGVLWVALLPCQPCRAFLTRGSTLGARQAPKGSQPQDFFQQQPQSEQPQKPQPRPVLLRVGEEYYLRLGNLSRNPSVPTSGRSSTLQGGSHSTSGVANFYREWLRQQPQRALTSPTGGAAAEEEKQRRSEEAPISLDLTFHLLREVLGMARDEQLAQQAQSNRKLLDLVGK